MRVNNDCMHILSESHMKKTQGLMGIYDRQEVTWQFSLFLHNNIKECLLGMSSKWLLSIQFVAN